MDSKSDQRIVLTLDAGGTTFRFSAICGNVPFTDTVSLPSSGDELDRCLTNIVEGFTRVRQKCPVMPVAISFALRKLDQMYGVRSGSDF
jgi:glucokinase